MRRASTAIAGTRAMEASAMGRRRANSESPASFIQKWENAETSGLLRFWTTSLHRSGPCGDEVCQVKISSTHRLWAPRFHRRSTAAASMASQRPRCRGPGVITDVIGSSRARATRSPARARPAGSVGALAREHRRYGPDEDPEIGGERLPTDVLEVKAHPLVESQAAAAGHLPQAGDARLDVETAALPGLVLLGLLGQRRTRTDQAHVALEHVEELGQLVHRRRPHPLADPGDTRVTGDLEDRTVGLVHVHELRPLGVGADVHRAQLVEGERPAVLAQARRLVERRADRKSTRLNS